MRNTKYCLFVGIVAVAAALLFSSGCRPAKGRDELVVANKGLPLSLTPHIKSEVITISVLGNLFESLVQFDPTMKIKPLLAESWENPDDLTWIFNIRRAVRFHDGSLLTADDVVYSLERARSYGPSELKSNFVLVDSIAKVDDFTVKVKTLRPFPILLNKLLDAFIVPRAILEKLGDDKFALAPVGTGAYRFVSYQPAGPLLLMAWEGYWGGKPDFSTVKYMPYRSAEEAIRLLEMGEIDIATEISPAVARKLDASETKGFSIVRQPGLTLRYLGVNTTVQPFRSRQVRQALMLAVDRDAVIKTVNHGFGTPAGQLLPQAVFGYNPAIPVPPYDPQQSKKLLAQAGHSKGLTLTLLLPDVRLSLGQELQRQMAAAGIDLKLNAVPRERFFDLVDSSDFFMLGSVSLSGDASDLFDDVIHTPGRGYGRDNLGHYNNPQIDKLIEGTSGYLNQTQRLAALQRIMDLVMQDTPRIPLYGEDEIYGISARLDWQPRLDMMVVCREVRRRR